MLFCVLIYIYMSVYLCMYMHVCMYVYDKCVYVYASVCACFCMYVCMYVCGCMCIYVRICVYAHVSTYAIVCVCFVWFGLLYGASNIVGYLMRNPLYTFILNINWGVWGVQGVVRTFGKGARLFFFRTSRLPLDLPWHSALICGSP